MIDWTGFDVPELRKNIDKPEDARWILRNLGIRNSKHPRFKEVINQCKDMEILWKILRLLEKRILEKENES